MKMEVIAVQQQYQTQFSGLGSIKYRDWTSTLTPPLSSIVNMNTNSTTTPNTTSSSSTTTTTIAKTPAIPIKNATANNSNINNNSSSSSSNNSSANRTPYQLHHHHYHHHHHNSLHNHRQTSMTNASSNKMKNSINNKKTNRQTATATSAAAAAAAATPTTPTTNNSNNFFYCDNTNAIAVNELSLRLLNELRAAKSRHLSCTEVSLPCDLTPSIAAEIIRVSEKEPCGIRGCTIYIEFEDEPNNSRRIASLKLDPETVSTFEVYLTLRQDHRGWASLLPQFMKSLARTITISPEFTITKHKLYSPSTTQQRLSFTATTAPTATPTARVRTRTSTTTTPTSTPTAAISMPSS